MRSTAARFVTKAAHCLLILLCSVTQSHALRHEMLFKSKPNQAIASGTKVFADLALAERIAHLFSELPILRDHLIQIITDSSAPHWLLNLVDEALAEDDIGIFNLTPDMKRRHQWQFGESFVAPQSMAFEVQPSKMAKSSNPTIAASVDGIIKEALDRLQGQQQDSKIKNPRFVLFVEDKQPRFGRTNSMMLLIHELAHIRFYRFINRYISQLVGLFPSEILKQKTDGSILINQDLYDYLNERHSFEHEFRLLQWLKANHRQNLVGAVPDFWINLNSSQYDSYTIGRLAREITGIYNLDPGLVSNYHKKTLNDILGQPLIVLDQQK